MPEGGPVRAGTIIGRVSPNALSHPCIMSVGWTKEELKELYQQFLDTLDKPDDN